MLRKKLHFVLVAILSVGLLGTAAGLLLVNARAPVNPKHAAEPEIYALLLVVDSQAGSWPKGGSSMPEGEDQAQFRRTQAVLLRSRTVLQAALEAKGMSDLAIVPKDQKAVTWLEENLVTEYLDNTAILRVSFTKRVSSEKPEEQATLLNAIVKEYLSRFGRMERDIGVMRLDDLKQIIEKRQHRIKEAHKQLGRSKGELNIGKPDEIALLRETLQQQEKELRHLGKEIVGIEARIKFRKESKQDTTQLREDLAVFQAQLPVLEDQVSTIRKELSNRSSSDVDIRMKEEHLAVAQKVLKRLQEEYELLDSFLQSSRLSRIQLLSPAFVEKAGK